MIRTCFTLLIAGLTGFSCLGEEITNDRGRNVEMPAVVLYKYGRVQSAGKPTKTGSMIKGGSLVKVGKRSVCDLQIRNARARIVLLMKENSELLLSAREYKNRTDLRFMLKKGRVSINVEKLQNQEHVYVYTPSTAIRVRGTRLTVQADDKGTHIQVFSGAAEVRPRLPILGRLPVDIRERSSFILELNRALKNTADIVDAGRQKSPDNKALAARLMKIPEYRAMSESPQIKALLGKELVQGEANDAALKLLKNDAPRTRAVIEGIKAYEPGYNVDYPTTKINVPKLKEASVEFLDMSGLSARDLADANRLVENARRYNKKRRKRQLIRLAQLSGKPIETIVLKSGAEYEGIIQETEGDYRVHTPEGSFRFSRSQVDYVKF